MTPVIDALYALVASDSWVAYDTYPVDYKGNVASPPFLRVSVVGSGADRAAYSTENKKRQEGLLLVQIVTESGRGQKTAASIADELEAILADGWLGTAQTGLGSLQFVGQDPDDSSKSIATYSVPFTHIGD